MSQNNTLTARLNRIASWFRNPANANGCEALELSFAEWCKTVEAAITTISTTQPTQAQQSGEVVGWRPLFPDRPKHLAPSDFTSGKPSQQTIDYWKSIGVQIEYAYSAPPAPAQPVPHAVKIHAHGGITGVCDYLMSDGTIKAMTAEEAKAFRKAQPVQGVPDVATWLWLRFADYCRKQGMNPHHQNDLFAIVHDLRAMLASPTPPRADQKGQ